VTAPSLDKWPEDQIPAVVVMSLGTSEVPLKSGDGSYTARWQMNLACICSARREAEARTMSMQFLAAHRTILLQRQSLGSNAIGVVWQDEDYTQLAYDDARTLCAAMAAFTVEVENVATAGAGPLTPDVPLDPDTDPWPLWPTVEEVDIEVDAVPTTEPLVRPDD